MKKLLIYGLLCVPSLVFAQKDILEPFPKAAQGQVRWVIEVPKKSNEDLFQIEIIPGKMMEIDCNRHFLIGELKEESLKGWSYTFYTFITNDNAASTRMACLESSKRTAFVSAASKTVRYNSKLPVVIYVPKGYMIEYRIWSAANKNKTAQEK